MARASIAFTKTNQTSETLNMFGGLWTHEKTLRLGITIAVLVLLGCIGAPGALLGAI